MKRVLITGVAGFIGSNLSESLLNRGDAVVGLDDFNDFYPPTIKRRNIAAFATHDRFTLNEVDIRDAASLREAFVAARPDVVVHLAAQAGVRPSIEDPNKYYRINVEGTQNVLDACRAVEPSHVVVASSSSVYGGVSETPFVETMDLSRVISPYAATKLMNESMCHVYRHLYDMRFTLLRFFTVYGPRQRPDMAIAKFTDLIARGEEVPVFGDGDTSRDYTYVDDIVAGVAAAVDTPLDFEILNLGRGQTIRLLELIETIAENLGVEAKLNHLPMQPGDMVRTFAKVDKARDLLSYAPAVSVREGVARYVDWYNQVRALAG